MNKSKHTNGPWTFSKTDDYVIEAFKAGAPYSICKYDVDSDNESEDLANANLILSAPELLEVVQQTLDFLTHDKVAPFLDGPLFTLRDNLKQAIAKAKGVK